MQIFVVICPGKLLEIPGKVLERSWNFYFKFHWPPLSLNKDHSSIQIGVTETFCPLGTYFGTWVIFWSVVLKHFWIKIYFFGQNILNKFSINTWYISKYDSIPQEAKCFNTPMSSSDMHQSHHLSGCHTTSINFSLKSFLSSLRFTNLICLIKKKLFWLEEIFPGQKSCSD